MAAAVYNVHHRHWHTVSGNAAKEAVKRNVKGGCSCTAASDGNSKDGICAKVGFVLCSVCLDHCFVNCINVRCVHSCDHIVNGGVDVLNSFCNAFSKVSALIIISKLQSLELSCRCTAWCCSSADGSVYQVNFSLYSRVSSGIHNLSSNDFLNF